MGADFLLVYAGLPENEEPEWERGAAFIESGGWKEGDNKEALLDQLGEEKLSDDLKPRLLSALENVKAAWMDERRDGGVMHFEGFRILMTGGMSWGDSPTDLFEDMEYLLNGGVFKAMGFRA